MALVIGQVNTPSRSFVAGDRVRAMVDITLDNSYPTGGYPLTPSQFGLSSLDLVDPNTSLAGNTYAYDYANQKLKVFAVGGAEVANAVNLSAVYVRVEVCGKGASVFSV